MNDKQIKKLAIKEYEIFYYCIMENIGDNDNLKEAILKFEKMDPIDALSAANILQELMFLKWKAGV